MPLFKIAGSLRRFSSFLEGRGVLFMLGLRPCRTRLSMFRGGCAGVLVVHGRSVRGLNLRLCRVMPLFSTLIASCSSVTASCLLLSGPVIFALSSCGRCTTSQNNLCPRGTGSCVDNCRMCAGSRLRVTLYRVTRKGSVCTDIHRGVLPRCGTCTSKGSSGHVLSTVNVG